MNGNFLDSSLGIRYDLLFNVRNLENDLHIGRIAGRQVEHQDGTGNLVADGADHAVRRSPIRDSHFGKCHFLFKLAHGGSIGNLEFSGCGDFLLDPGPERFHESRIQRGGFVLKRADDDNRFPYDGRLRTGKRRDAEKRTDHGKRARNGKVCYRLFHGRKMSLGAFRSRFHYSDGAPHGSTLANGSPEPPPEFLSPEPLLMANGSPESPS